MPLMMPAAVTGIHAICTAQIVRPSGPNRALLIAIINQMLAVNADPFPGDNAAGEPQPETEEVADDGVQVDGVVRLRTVQEDGDGGDGDVGETEGHHHITPPR